MKLDSFFLGSFQDENYLYIPIPPNKSPMWLVIKIIKDILNYFEGELTTPEGEILTTPEGETLTYNNRNTSTSINCYIYKEQIEGGYYHWYIVFTEKKLFVE